MTTERDALVKALSEMRSRYERGHHDYEVIDAAIAALSSEQEAVGVCWLLEKVKSNPSDETLYYKQFVRPINGGRDDLHTVNPDPLQARRFQSKEAAEEYAKRHDFSDVLFAAEHIFGCGTLPDRVEDLDIPAMLRAAGGA